jgi:type IV pilus assembly protein PilC
LKGKIITALSYPAILVSVALGVLTYFIVSIIPKFALTFADFNMELPFLTRMIINISNLLSGNIVAIMVAIVLFVIFFRIYISTDAGRLTYNRFTLRLPVFGKFIRNVQFERLLTTMATLIKSGVSILTVITVLEEGFSKNLVIKRALKNIRQDVASGKSISVSFKNTKVFPNMITEMMWMGEESGKLPDIINILSKFYVEKINQFIARFSSLIDPILILFVGGVIGTVIISLFLPIFKLTRIGVISG